MSDACKRLCAYLQGPLLVVDCTTSIGERAQETGKEKCELILAQTLAPLVISLIFLCFVPNFYFPIPHARRPLPVRLFSNIYTFFSLLFLKFLNDYQHPNDIIFLRFLSHYSVAMVV